MIKDGVMVGGRRWESKGRGVFDVDSPDEIICELLSASFEIGNFPSL